MTTKIRRTARTVLTEMQSRQGKEFISSVDELTSLLENKPDASTQDLFLLQSICQVSQDLQILKEALENYSSGFSCLSTGAKLSQLLERRNNKYEMFG